MQSSSRSEEEKEIHEFHEKSGQIINYITEYWQRMGEYRVISNVSPGYLAPLLPIEAPTEPESWERIIEDVDKLIMPGVTHWQHPQFHAFFPTGASYPSLCADLLSGAISCIGFSWASSPACTELEVVMLDWLAKLMKLPQDFMSSGKGGGVIQGSVSEATLISMLTARTRAIAKYMEEHPNASKFDAAAKLVGYHSDQAHSSVERAGLIAMMCLRTIPTNTSREFSGDALREAVENDIQEGLIPFFCAATLGTTASCAVDRLDELGPICEQYDIWLHVDAAYAGAAFICPEFQHHMNGIQHVSSYVFSPHKWFLVNFECSCMWVKDCEWLIRSFSVDPIYLKHRYQGAVPDFRHWQIPLGRRFRSLKLWFVMRRYGVNHLQIYIRNHVSLAHYFEELISNDERFEVVNKVTFGLVCFRIKNDNARTRRLHDCLHADGRVYMIPSEFAQPEQIYFLRFIVCHRFATRADIDYAFNVICEVTERV